MRHTILLLFLTCIGLGCNDEADTTSAGSQPEPIVSETIPNTLEQIRNDMAEPHQAIPNGIDGQDWRLAPRVGYGNQPPEGWSAMTTWGQVYAPTTGNPATNTRFQIKNMQTWYLSKATGEWISWQTSSNVGGANYAEDFQNDLNIPADLRREEEGYSANLQEGYNFHFWPQEGRVTIDPDDIAAVWTAIDGRLILDDHAGVNDMSQACMMMSVGADYWTNRSAEWDQWTTNGDIGIGRFRYLTKDWQTFNMHTMTKEQLTQQPPPFER